MMIMYSLIMHRADRLCDGDSSIRVASAHSQSRHSYQSTSLGISRALVSKELPVRTEMGMTRRPQGGIIKFVNFDPDAGFSCLDYQAEVHA